MNTAITDPHLMKSGRSLRSLFKHSFVLTKRSVLGRLRQPAIIAPSFIFPLFFAALGSASFHKLAEDPYFTKNIATSFLNYAIAGAVLQGVLFASTSAAADLAIDIEQGFFERLLASPISRTSIVLGRLAGSMVVAVFQVTIFLMIFIGAGARIKSGAFGFLGLVIGGALLSLAMSAMMAGLAIKSGSSEVVQSVFPLTFVLMFLSSAFYPRHYMSGWYRTVADWNPISHIVEGFQGFINQELDFSQFAKAWLLPLAIATVSIFFALRSLSKRLAAS